MANKMSYRLQTPADANGYRTDIHLITSSDEVIVTDGDKEKTLTEKLNEIDGMTISKAQPDFPCIWAQTSYDFPSNIDAIIKQRMDEKY